jgi:RNA polymerase-interacting CarD/CdnL/TRCF family regulator
MGFHVGDPVMHWTYGLGQITQLEERAVSGKNTLYFAVQIRDMTVWVPADDKLENRLRPPTQAPRFKRLLGILTGPSEPLPIDRQERKLYMLELLKDGRAESICRVIRDLTSFRKAKPLNDNDQAVLKRLQSALLSEWGFALSITPAEAELEMRRLLAPASTAD